MKVIAFLITLALTALLFLWWPDIDIAASRLLFREGEGFFLGHGRPVRLLYNLVNMISLTVAVGFILWLAARAIGPLKRFHVRSSAMFYIALSLALGPGLITNTILKDNFGRARPKQVVEFGGERRFTPAPLPADQCRSNCSFVSGHAATGFFLVTFAFLMAPGRRRRAAFAGAVALGAAIGWARMAEGDHFLSDVVFAGLINFAVAWGLYAWLGARGSPGDRGLARWEARLRAKARPGAFFVSQGHAFGAVLMLGIVCYVFIDRPALRWFETFNSDLHLTVKWIADFGRQIFWAVPSGVAFIALWLAARQPRFKSSAERLKAWSMLPLFVFVSLSVTGIVSKLMKVSFGRMRPLHDFRHHDYGFSWFTLDASMQSFPSGHAVTIATLLAALYFIWPRYIAAYIVIGAIMIASRTMETAHYISDVVIGAYLGIVMTAWVHRVFARSGVDLELAKAGRFPAGEKLPWAQRLGIPQWLARRASPSPEEAQKPVPADPS